MPRRPKTLTGTPPTGGPDPARPREWKRYRNGMCKGCWAGCCTLPVEVSASDLMRLGVVTEAEAAVGLASVAKRLLAEGLLQHFRPASGVFILSQQPNGACVYLGPDRRCTVYGKRPEVCRAFPEVGPRPGYCPQAKI